MIRSKTAKAIIDRQTSSTSTLRQVSQQSGFISGQKVFLEGLSMWHFSPDYVSWLNDSIACRENRHGVFPYTGVGSERPCTRKGGFWM